MNLEIMKNKIKQIANNDFPADELWIKEDFSFWAFAKENNKIILTEGFLNNEDFLYDTNILYISENENIDNTITLLCAEKTQNNYVCFAILI